MDHDLFHSIVEDAPEPVFIHISWKFIYLNPAAYRLFGEEPGRGLINESVVERIHPDFREKFLEQAASIYSGDISSSASFELKVLRPCGRELWIETFSKTVDLTGGEGILVFARDISDRKETEMKLLHNREKYRNLFRNHTAVKLIIDPVTGDIADANIAAARYYGWSIEELKTMKISMINTLSPQEIKSEMERAAHVQKNHFNFRHRTASGDVRDVEVFTSPHIIDGREFLHSIIHDVTAKRTAEKKLKLLYRSVEQSPVSILITDTDGRIEYVNPGFEKASGYSFKEVRGRNPRILNANRQPGEFYRELWKTILSGKDWSGELLNRKKDGDLYWERAVISPILDENGRVTNFVSIKEDITQAKKIVEELVVAKEKAEENDRLKSAFLTNMSHEIRTPMNGILGFAGILKNKGLSETERQKFIGIVEKSGRRLLDTVNDLIDISRIETGQVNMYISENNLQEIIDHHYQFFLPQAREKNIRLILKDRVPRECAIMQTDRSKLDSILSNLIKNAIKFTEKGRIEIGCTRASGSLRFYVSDTGIGVPVNRREAIFNRFEQADINDRMARQGSGLGLPIARSYAAMLGGNLWMEPGEEGGSTFIFALPCNCASPAPTERKREPGIAATNKIPCLKGRRILLAEDDIFSREMMLYLLGKTGAMVETASEGTEAVEIFSRDEFDMVLLDIQLPGLSGFGVIEKLHAMKPGSLVVAQTAYAMLDDISRFKKAGFTGYLTKPIRQEALYDLLDKHLAGDQPPAPGCCN